MTPVRLTDNNAIFGLDQKGVIPVHATCWNTARGEPRTSIAWQPSPEEIAAMKRGLPVIVDISGTGMPPMWVRVGEPAEEAT